MEFGELVPWFRSPRALGPSMAGVGTPAMSTRGDFNRFVDDLMRSWEPSFYFGRDPWPRLEVNETDNEVKVVAELPGMAERDITLTVTDGILSISGEQKSETADDKRGYSERFFGRFERRIALPTSVAEDGAQADMVNGLLTVTFAKAKESDRNRRIRIGEPAGNGPAAGGA